MENLPKIPQSNILFNMKRFLVLFLLFCFLTSLFAPATYARRRRRRRVPGRSSSIGASTRVFLVRRRGGRALLLRFYGLSRVSSVNYILSYTSNSIPQGVGGSLNLTGANSDSRELLFGTCSGGICVHHTNITNMKLTVVSSPKTGRIKKITRSYRKAKL